MINPALLFTILALSLAIQGGAFAAVFQHDWLTPGDGLLTYDDVNQREWLDLTQTQLQMFPGDSLAEQYSAVVMETEPGGAFAGFSVGTAFNVTELAESAGIVTTTLDFATNATASESLIDLLGDATTLSETSTSTRSRGYLQSQLNALTALEVVYVPNGRDLNAAGLASPPALTSYAGVWLYRQVPEPSSILLAMCILPIAVRLHLHFR